MLVQQLRDHDIGEVASMGRETSRPLLVRIVNGYRIFFDWVRWRWVFSHRRAAEKALGCKIPFGHEVHHKDGNKWNNRPDNLVVMSREAHAALHRLQQRMVHLSSMARPRRNYSLSSTRPPVRILPACPRCGGTGYLPEYRHVQGGVCFRCGGEGRDSR